MLLTSVDLYVSVCSSRRGYGIILVSSMCRAVNVTWVLVIQERLGQCATEMLTDGTLRINRLKRLAYVTKQLEKAEWAEVDGQALSDHDLEKLWAVSADLQLLFAILFWLSPEEFQGTVRKEIDVSSLLLTLSADVLLLCMVLSNSCTHPG